MAGPRRGVESSGRTARTPPVCLLTVSRPLELSLQSSFQLSLTVLVDYRSRAGRVSEGGRDEGRKAGRQAGRERQRSGQRETQATPTAKAGVSSGPAERREHPPRVDGRRTDDAAASRGPPPGHASPRRDHTRADPASARADPGAAGAKDGWMHGPARRDARGGGEARGLPMTPAEAHLAHTGGGGDSQLPPRSRRSPRHHHPLLPPPRPRSARTSSPNGGTGTAAGGTQRRDGVGRFPYRIRGLGPPNAHARAHHLSLAAGTTARRHAPPLPSHHAPPAALPAPTPTSTSPPRHPNAISRRGGAQPPPRH
ncbi:basic salivary proline-rich protein 4-like [Oryctolagus cuniculus]|uniref:basic salivary proline-rich protein 4-like n=1 Tax=Oryctolagus cuniculus TaxID=9986 RepID=UPI0038790BC6